MRALGAAHVAVGILLLPASLFFGFPLLPLVGLGPLWLIVLGVRLWRGTPHARVFLARTHLPGLAVALFMLAHGMHSFFAAQRSADGGGGLVGSYALIPLGFGLLLGALSAASLGALADPGRGRPG